MESKVFYNKKIIDSINSKPAEKRTVNEIQLYANYIRKNILYMVYTAKSGHPGGPLGLADIFAVIYLEELNQSPESFQNNDRNRILLSNGHVCAVQYAAMAQRGFFEISELSSFRKLGSRLQGHPSSKFLPFIENSSGSLGQGLSQAVGTALALKQKKSSARVYIGISDGECQEGMTWEAAMSGAHYKLNNIIAFVDYNHIQIDGKTEEVMNLGNLAAKFKEFGWDTIEANGHDIEAIREAFKSAKTKREAPVIILFNTVLGKNVSFMENNPKWHGTPPGDTDYEKAIAELDLLETQYINSLK